MIPFADVGNAFSQNQKGLANNTNSALSLFFSVMEI